jgi:hypothetical protein
LPNVELFALLFCLVAHLTRLDTDILVLSVHREENDKEEYYDIAHKPH